MESKITKSKKGKRNYKPFKNRVLNKLKPVEVYRCLNRKGRVFSIRQNGLVVGHTITSKEFRLFNCDFVINRAGKMRCIEEKQRNVHAFIKGFVTSRPTAHGIRVKYNPYSTKGFHTIKGEVRSAWFVRFDSDDGVFCVSEKYKDVPVL